MQVEQEIKEIERELKEVEAVVSRLVEEKPPRVVASITKELKVRGGRAGPAAVWGLLVPASRRSSR